MVTRAIWAVGRESRFLADLTSRDRDLRTLLLTVLIGLLAAVVAGLLGVLAACLAMMIIVSGLDGVPSATALFAVFDQPALARTDARASLFQSVVLAAGNGAAALAFVAVAASLSHRPWQRYGVVDSGFRSRLLIAGLVLVGGLMAGLFLISVAVSSAMPTAPILTLASTPVGRITFASLSVVVLVVAAAAEEVLFRGWLLKQSAAFTRNPVLLMALNGLLFAAIHFDPSLEAFVLRAAMGAGLTWMTLRTGGIELAIGAHAAHNIIVMLLVRPVSPPDEVVPLPRVSETFQLESLVVAAVVGLAYVALAEAVVRWPAMTRWIDRRGDPAPV
jgi:membrane protease YdiL (CAAX protease family)